MTTLWHRLRCRLGKHRIFWRTLDYGRRRWGFCEHCRVEFTQAIGFKYRGPLEVDEGQYRLGGR